MKFMITSKKLVSTAFFACISATMLSACGTTAVSHDISKEGHIDASNLVWPELDKAWQKEGQFPNSENLSKIKAGIAKDELYQLIGRPHFSERQHAKEWNYIMKFYQADNSVKICQYKVIFDKDYKGQEFYWLPADCPPKKAPKAEKVVPVVAPTKVTHKKISLDADALFDFNEYKLDSMQPEGRAKLDKLAEQLRGYSEKGDIRIHIIGHTDRKGSDEYNMTLSQNRANSVLAYLASNGIRPARTATGVGKSFPVVDCPTDLSAQEEIDCLQPNRRVDVDVEIHNYK